MTVTKFMPVSVHSSYFLPLLPYAGNRSKGNKSAEILVEHKAPGETDHMESAN